MNRFYDYIFGTGYETRMLSKRSPQVLFMLLLIYVFFLGMLLDGAFVKVADRWLFVLIAIVAFRDARVIYGVLCRAKQPEASSFSISASSN